MADQRKLIREKLKDWSKDLDFANAPEISIFCEKVLSKIREKAWPNTKEIGEDVKNQVTLPNDVSWGTLEGSHTKTPKELMTALDTNYGDQTEQTPKAKYANFRIEDGQGKFQMNAIVFLDLYLKYLFGLVTLG